jgi:hypothetical protein
VKFGGSVKLSSSEDAGHIGVATKKVRITVANEDVVLNVKLAAGATVAGTIRVDGAVPEKADDMAPAVVPATDASPPPSDSRNSIRSYVRSQGRFEIDRLAEGKYWFAISGFMPDRYYVKSVTRKGVDLAQKPFTLTAGSVFDEVVVTFATDVARIEGELTDFKPRKPSERLTVTLAPANDATRRFSPGVVTANADAQGRFAFSCGPGEYLVTVLNGPQRRVTVSAGEKIKIRL